MTDASAARPRSRWRLPIEIAVVLAIASQSGGVPPVRDYAMGAGLDPGQVALDSDGSIAQRFGVRAFPTTFYVAPDGRVSTVEVGYTSELGMRLRAWWAD